MVRQRHALGILGIIFAVLGGTAWFVQQRFIAIMLWGIAGIILLKLNKRKTRIRTNKQRR